MDRQPDRLYEASDGKPSITYECDATRRKGRGMAVDVLGHSSEAFVRV